MQHLFAYGSLMCPDIMRLVSGVEPISQPARLRGYRRCRVRNEPYPAVIADRTATLDGVLYRDLNTSAWERLDRFEGDLYQRIQVRVGTGQGVEQTAGLYLATPALQALLIPGDWSFEQFLREGKSRFERDYRGFEGS